MNTVVVVAVVLLALGGTFGVAWLQEKKNK